MSETQHTQGPWKATGYYVRQSGASGTRMIADICYTGPHHTPPDEYPKSCRIADEANARLIASAPELLSSLQRAEECLSDMNYHDEYLRDLIHQAINKATGKEAAQ